MRVILPGMSLAVIAFWGWLALSGSALLVWAWSGPGEWNCSYLTARDVVKLRYDRPVSLPPGQSDACPLHLRFLGPAPDLSPDLSD